MSIHVADPSGQQKEYSEQELRSLWDQGRIDSSAMYWKEGMDGWQPLAGYLSPYAPPQISVQPPSIPSPSRYSYVKDPRTLTKLLLVMLFITLGMEVVCLLGDVAQLLLLERPFTVDEGHANDARQRALWLASVGVFIVTGVVFLKWISRAGVNSRGFGVTDMEHSPGWAVGSYFVPILSLFRPYQAMKEIWQVSHDPVNWRQVPASWVMACWWTLWLLAGLLGQISFRIANSADTIEGLKVSTIVSIISNAEGIALALVAIKLVRTIAGNQEKIVRDGESEMSGFY